MSFSASNDENDLDLPDDDAPVADEGPESESPEPSLGPSNVFEVEESAPDGASIEPDEPEPAPVRVPEGRVPSREELELARTGDNGSSQAEATTHPALDDDDEPAPVLSWYVLKVQSGRENTIRDALERRVKIEALQPCFGRLVVPTEKVTEIRNNKKKIVERKSYPGYIMVEMELNEKTWFLVRETPGVGDFVGAHGKPSPMSADEVNKMLYQEEEQKPGEQPKVKIYVERGDRVKIKDGPFENFEGDVEEVVEARGLVKVMLIIFNRPTPVDLEYWQVERI